MMRFLVAIVALCTLSVAYAQRNAYICEILLSNFCAGQNNCPADPTITFGNTQYDFDNFNVVSFGNFYASSGDIEGRAAIRGNLSLPDGQYSFGYQLRTGGASAVDLSLPYSLVVGGDAVFAGGAVYPDGSNYPYVGAEENIFVGGTFNAPSYLQSRRTGGPCASAGCLDADFDNAQAYYNELSTEFSALADNAQYTIQYGTLTLTCNSMADSNYVIHVTPNDFSTITFWSVQSSCNPQSALIVNIVGAGSQVQFNGNQQAAFFLNQKILFNVVPAGSSTPSVLVTVGVDGNLLAPSSQYNQPHEGVFIGQVIVGNIIETLQINKIACIRPPTPNNNNDSNNLACPSWETNCNGLNFVLGGSSFSFADFNAVVFGDFNASTGDIQGRLAVQGSATFGSGYSVGDQLSTAANTPDVQRPYSLIVGYDLTWGSGALYPEGNGIPFPGPEEDMYVGGTFSTSESDLTARRTGGPCGTPGCLDSIFSAAKSCYEGYTSTLSSQTDNVQQTVQWDALEITCSDSTASDYRITLTASQLLTFTYITVTSCNFQANWWITISGTDNVEITAGSFPAVTGAITYIVPGSRTIYIHDTELDGHLLAPSATLNQPNGVIKGKVVVGNVISSKQINKQNTCAQVISIQIPSIVVADTDSRTANMNSNSIQAGDSVALPYGTATAASVDGNSVTFTETVHLNAGDVCTITVQSDDSRVVVGTNSESSSASVVSIAISALLALIALAF